MKESSQTDLRGQSYKHRRFFDRKVIFDCSELSARLSFQSPRCGVARMRGLQRIPKQNLKVESFFNQNFKIFCSKKAREAAGHGFSFPENNVTRHSFTLCDAIVTREEPRASVSQSRQQVGKILKFWRVSCFDFCLEKRFLGASSVCQSFAPPLAPVLDAPPPDTGPKWAVAAHGCNPRTAPAACCLIFSILTV